MRKIVKLLCAVVMLPVAIASAQDKVAPSAKSGHEAMAKGGAGKSDAAIAEW